MNHLTLFLTAVANTEDLINGEIDQLVTEHPGLSPSLLLTAHFGIDMHPTALEFFISLQKVRLPLLKEHYFCLIFFCWNSSFHICCLSHLAQFCQILPSVLSVAVTVLDIVAMLKVT